MMENEIILSLSDVSKTFPGVKALDNLKIDFLRGEIHALAGENGAGKSTLIKIICGVFAPNSGTIWFEGKKISKMTPDLANEIGIAVIHQEFNLIPTLSAAENVFLGRPILKHGLVDHEAMHRVARNLFSEFNIDINPKTKVKDLSAAYQQIVEICKALSRHVKVLIMDEPSAPLTNSEVEILFKIVKKLKQKGVTVIYISHRFEEIFELSDRVTTLRDGELIETKRTKDINRQSLIKAMVGRSLKETFPIRDNLKSDVALELIKVSGKSNKNLSFKAYAGEILGIAGLVGSGRTEAMRLIFGADPKEKGEILVDGTPTIINNPRDAIRAGIGLIPEDRKQQGIILEMPIDKNISLASLPTFTRCGLFQDKREALASEKYIDFLKIKTPHKKQVVKNLSGGNQQKVVLAKWLTTESKILIFDEPTRGIDVSAKQFIYKLMNELTNKGTCIIMVSSDMEELIGMSDRILVFHQGIIAGELGKDEINQEKILELASGIHAGVER